MLQRFALAAAFAWCAAAAAADVLTYHNDPFRSGQNTNETVLTSANVNSNQFGLLFAYPVDGQVYAQPLFVSGLAIPGQGTHNVVFVATMHDSLYAFDADSNAGPNGGRLWQVSLGTSAATPNNDFGNRYGAYHDIRPEVGIVGTPVIDLAAGTLFVDAFTHEGATCVHRVHALNLLTGAEQPNSPAVVNVSIPGSGVGSSGGVLPFDPMNNGLQRVALTLAGGMVYVSYSGFADSNPYHGWIMGFDEHTLQLRTNYVFNTTPNSTVAADGSNAGEGGLWMGGNGPAVDEFTNLYVMVANGVFNANTGGTEYADSFLRLSTSGGLTVADYFTPHNQATLAANDTDLGSGGPLLLPNEAGSLAHPHLVVGAGKSGIIFLLDREGLGRFNSVTDTQIVQSVSGAIGGVFGTPAYFNYRLYYQAIGDHLKMFSITNATLSTSALSQSPGTIGFPGATPCVSANGTNDAIVWVLDSSASSAGSPTGPAVLHAFNAYNLAKELYNSSQAGPRDAAPWAVKTSVPTIANGKVYVGGATAVSVYGGFNFTNTTIAITAPPTNTVGVQSVASTFAVGATAAYVGAYTNGPPPPTIAYQWQAAPAGSATFTNIPGATANLYQTARLNLGESGEQFRVVLTAPGTVITSAVARVTLVPNTVPPLPLEVVSVDAAGVTVTVAFSQPLEPATAQTAANYSFSAGNQSASSATLDGSGTNVILTVANPLPPSTPITLSFANLRSVCGLALPAGTSISFSFTPAASAAYATTILAGNPLGYWRLNETTGPTALDSVGAHNGTYASAAAPGRTGPRPPDLPGFESSNLAVETFVNTASSYVSVPFGSLSTNTVTFTSWVYPLGMQANWAGLLVSRGGGASGGMNYNAQQMLAYTWNNNNGNTYNFVSGLVIPSNQWSLVAMVIYPTQAVLYLDNTNGLRAATNPVAHTPDVFGNNWQIGNDNNDGSNDGSRGYNGFMDEVAVFKQSLSSNQIAALYQAAQHGGGLVNDLGSTPGTLRFTSVEAVAGQLVLQWLGTATLEEAPTIMGPWTPCAEQNEPLITPIGGNRFYRLHR